MADTLQGMRPPEKHARILQHWVQRYAEPPVVWSWSMSSDWVWMDPNCGPMAIDAKTATRAGYQYLEPAEYRPVSKRSFAGPIWMQVCHNFVEAQKKGNTDKSAALLALLDGIEAEFPEDVAAEKAYWTK